MAICNVCGKKWYCKGQDMGRKINNCRTCQCPECKKKGAEEAPLQTL